MTLGHTDTHKRLTHTPHTDTDASKSKSEIIFKRSVVMMEDFKEEGEQEVVNLPEMSKECRLLHHSADRGQSRTLNFGK